MHQASTQKIEAVLTDEQRQKFDADQQKMQERRSEQMHGGGQGSGDAGQPPAQPQ
jgi:Spy/CpxP family protein refolding chaperone